MNKIMNYLDRNEFNFEPSQKVVDAIKNFDPKTLCFYTRIYHDIYSFHSSINENLFICSTLFLEILFHVRFYDAIDIHSPCKAGAIHQISYFHDGFPSAVPKL